MLFGISLIILGILAVPSLIVSRQPNAQAILDKIVPFQGIIGVVFCFWGIWGLISTVLYIGALSHSPILLITLLVCTIVITLLGFILGYGLIAKYVLSNNAEASAKGEQLLAKIAPLQGTLGLISIGFGIWVVIAHLIYHL